MIDARKANFESKNLKEVRRIEKELEQAVLKAIDKGEFKCKVSISLDLKKEIRQRIRQDMEELGYEIYITTNNETERGCPANQCSYYDFISLSWEC